MQTFSGPVFYSLRRSLGLSEEEYRSSLSSDDFYLQFISNSKSKADFFITYVHLSFWTLNRDRTTVLKRQTDV